MRVARWEKSPGTPTRRNLTLTSRGKKPLHSLRHRWQRGKSRASLTNKLEMTLALLRCPRSMARLAPLMSDSDDTDSLGMEFFLQRVANRQLALAADFALSLPNDGGPAEEEGHSPPKILRCCGIKYNNLLCVADAHDAPNP